MKKQLLPLHDLKNYLFLTLIGFILIFVFAMASPFYHTNTWSDANAFMTMGDSIANGLVPYRDMFEQKGPLLYLMHALGSLITPHQFWTIAVIEAIGLSVSLIFIYKIAKIYLTNFQSVIVSLLFPSVFLNWKVFQTGDSAEEFIVPLILVSLYFIVKSLKNNLQFSKSNYFWFGIFVGCALWIKFTLLGFWIGLYAFIFFYNLFHKRFKELFFAAFFTFIGLLVVTLPILYYFYINDAIYELFDVYFIFNITAYPSSENYNAFGSLFAPILRLVSPIGWSFKAASENMFRSLVLVAGVILFCFRSKYGLTKAHRFLMFTLVFFTFYLAYFGTKAFVYYFLIVLPFTVFFFLAIVDMFQNIEFVGAEPSKRVKSLIIAGAITISTAITLQDYSSIGQLRFVKNIMPVQYIFANIMHNRSESPTLLNYATQDFGFYNAAGIVPSGKYFQNMNITYQAYPYLMDGQDEMVRSRSIEFVVVVEFKHFNPSINYVLLDENYNLIDSRVSFYNNQIYPFTYRLYQRK